MRITHHFSIAHVLTTVGGRARHPHPPQRGCHFSTDPVPAVVLIDVYYVNIGLFRLRGDQLVIMLWLFWACFLVVACVAVCRITLSNKNTGTAAATCTAGRPYPPGNRDHHQYLYPICSYKEGCCECSKRRWIVYDAMQRQ